MLTTDRVIYRSGVVAKHGIEIPLQRINTIFFSQRIFERLLGLGDLKIESASETGRPGVRGHPQPRQGAARHLRADGGQREPWPREARRPPRVQAVPGGSAGRAAAPAAPSATDQIAELHRLHQSGALTDAEFEAKKAELLGRM